MSHLNKGDVKNHLSTRDRNGRRLYAVPSVADATGFSNGEAGPAEAAAAHAPEESLGQAVSPDHRPAVLAPVLGTAASKRERA